MKREHSNQYFTEAQKLFPGGVNSPVRAFKAVGGHPLFIEKASGAYLHDVDGNRYIDFPSTSLAQPEYRAQSTSNQQK